MSFRLIAVAAIAMSVMGAGAANATLVGTSVTGSVQFPSGTNFFDPANGLVPAGYGNSSPGTNTVVVTNPGNPEFGFFNNAQLTIKADLLTSILTITQITTEGGSGFTAEHFVFTDLGFNTLSLISSTFPTTPTYSLLSNTATIDFAAFGTGAHTYVSSFRVQTEATAVPEPLTLSLFGAGVGGMALIRRKRKKAA